MELKRQHIFDDILGGSRSTYHSAILTCYSFDPLFYANFFKPQLNARGILNQLVLIDANRLDEAKEDERFSFTPGTSSFEGYTPIRIECKSGGVFHSKIGLFVGEKQVTAVIGSGNLTYSGMSYNDEAWGAFCISSTDAFEAPIISAVWHYLKSIIAQQKLSMATLQLSWMLENSELLQHIDAINTLSATAVDDAGESFEFAANTESGSIFNRLVEAVGDDTVKRITVCTPFFDVKGSVLNNLLRDLSPLEINCLIHPDEGSLPTDLNLQRNPNIHFFDYSVSGEKRSKMVHAKLIQIESSSVTVLAIGSANASIQALGETNRGVNDEADIIIKNSKKRDYFKDLGITLEEEIFDLASSGKFEKTDDKKKTSPIVVIQSCELLDDGFHIIIEKGPIANIDLHLVDDFRKEHVLHFSLDNGSSVIPNETGRIARTVYLTKDGERISNKCVILIQSEIERKNPDKIIAPIARLLETAQDSADFERLLQYVHIEEENSTKGNARVVVSDGKKNESGTGREFTDEDFDKKVFRNRQATMEQINDRILDRLAALLFASDDTIDYSEMLQDEATSQKDIDSGILEEDCMLSRQRKGGKTPKEYSVMDEARGYFKKLLKHYDLLSWNKPDFNKVGSGILIQRPFYIQEQSDLSYSAICIAVYEMLRIAKKGDRDEWKEMLEFFVPIVGSYLLIFRTLPSSLTATTALKMSRKQRNLVVFSLLLISFWKDYRPRETLRKILTLNLFDSYRNNLDELKSVFAEYEDILDKNIILPEPESIDMIHQCYAGYLAFIQNKEEHRMQLTPEMDNIIIFRQSFGFLLMTDIKYSPHSTKECKEIIGKAIAPGFPELIATRSRKEPPRGMISGVTLSATAFVYDKGAR
ncbi:MAG: hypothetical protein J5699_01475 [Bacteroidales bacterium]|nr:hypothetical protein [Bacteroidales bacterium]